MGLCKKKGIKDAYPKKICHMLRHVQNKICIPKEGMPHADKACQKKERKREEKKIAPIQRKKETRGRWFIQRSSFTIHQKYISTHLHILIKVYDLFILWIRFLILQNMRSKFAFIPSIPTAPPKRSLRSRMEKKGKFSKPWWGWIPLSDLRVPFEEKFELCFHLQKL